MRPLTIAFMILSSSLLFLMLLFYIPPYQKMFDSLGGKLPEISIVMITMSQFVQANIFFVIPIVLVGLTAIVVATVDNDKVLVLIGSCVILLFLGLSGMAYLAVQLPLAELRAAIGHA
jgi:hypothetical protein